MSISFQKSDGGISFKGNSGQTRNQPPGIRISVAVAIVPYQGFGQKFLTPTPQPPISPWTNHTVIGGTLNGLNFDTLDNSYLYQTITAREDFTSGAWWQRVISFSNAWVNGFGMGTMVVSAITQSSVGPPTDPIDPVYGFIGLEQANSTTLTTTDLVITSGTWKYIAQPGFSGGPWYSTQTTTLSGKWFYTDSADQSKTLLDALPIPSLPAPDPTPPNGSYYSEMIWPDTVSTHQTTTGTPISYLIGAAMGMATDASGVIVNGSISSQYAGSGGFPANAIFSAKSVWSFTANPYGVSTDPTPPFELYCRLLDSSLTPQAVQDCNIQFFPGQTQVFTPSTTSDFGHSGSDIPNEPFGGTFSPPYSPGGYGEIGFQSATYP